MPSYYLNHKGNTVALFRGLAVKPQQDGGVKFNWIRNVFASKNMLYGLRSVYGYGNIQEPYVGIYRDSGVLRYATTRINGRLYNLITTVSKSSPYLGNIQGPMTLSQIVDVITIEEESSSRDENNLNGSPVGEMSTKIYTSGSYTYYGIYYPIIGFSVVSENLQTGYKAWAPIFGNTEVVRCV